jgi:spoIIIJ-associated protein
MSNADAPVEGARDQGDELEAAGETVGEAKWAALREFERRYPGLDKSLVEFTVLSEGERGLLGVGFVPARVRARLAGATPFASSLAETPLALEAAERVQQFVEHVRAGLALDASATVQERGGALLATFHGRDLGLLIGKHGQTIDAVQYLANAIASRAGEERVEVVIDAAGYRDRRKATLEALADRTAEHVVASGQSVVLDPMPAAERKIVHLRLKERSDVTTSSDGAEPNRYVVVSPARSTGE